MAGRFFESFGHVTTATGTRKFVGYCSTLSPNNVQVATTPLYGSIDASAGWDTKGAFVITNGTGTGIRIYPGAMGTLPAARSQWFVGARIRHDDFDNAYRCFLVFGKTNKTNGYFLVNTNGTVSYYAIAAGANSGTLVATSEYALNTGVRYYFVIHPIIGETGSCAMRVDGTEILSAAQTTADNRGQNTTADVDTFDVALGGDGEIDDVVVWDTSTTDGWGNPDPLYSWVGDLRVYPLSPVTPDTAQTDFTPSTGSDNFALVDEKALSDTDYVSSTIVGHQDLYNMEDLTGTVGAIYGVQLNVCAQKDQPDTRTLTGQILPGDGGATVADGDTHTLTTAWKIHRDIWGTNPADDAVWEEADVNAIVTGFELAS